MAKNQGTVLTHRHIQVLRLIEQGLTSPEIAECLGVKKGTVKTFRVQAYHILGVHRAEDAVNEFRARGGA